MAEFYMRDIHAWRKDTVKLSFEEQGYYSSLLDLIYLYDDCLPDDDNFICQAMPVNKRIHIRVKKILIKNEFIEVQNGFITNSKATKELLKINLKSTQNKLKSDKRWAKSRKTNKKSDTMAMPRQCEGESEGEGEYKPHGLSREGNYEFEGVIVKLNKADYDRWKTSYSAIPDFKSQLQAADDWIRGEDEKQQKRWFNVISGLLSNKHSKFLIEEKKDNLNGYKERPRGMM